MSTRVDTTVNGGPQVFYPYLILCLSFLIIIRGLHAPLKSHIGAMRILRRKGSRQSPTDADHAPLEPGLGSLETPQNVITEGRPS
jgi:hypothetical protein